MKLLPLLNTCAFDSPIETTNRVMLRDQKSEAKQVILVPVGWEIKRCAPLPIINVSLDGTAGPYTIGLSRYSETHMTAAL